MYTKQQASQLRQAFWTAFGKYMSPVPGAEGEKVNWINYKTGVRHIYFRMDASQSSASISIQVTGNDSGKRDTIFEKIKSLKKLLHEALGEEWNWNENISDEHGKPMHSISKELKNVNVFSTESWPQIISFFKPRMIALDAFWQLVKDRFGEE